MALFGQSSGPVPPASERIRIGFADGTPRVHRQVFLEKRIDPDASPAPWSSAQLVTSPPGDAV